jgi:nucleolar MIF4G domain-containing protein 1
LFYWVFYLSQSLSTTNPELSQNRRLTFMLETLQELKHTKKKKQQQVTDVELVLRLRKVIARLKLKKGKSGESSLNMSLRDILDVQTKGRWWLTGASWVGREAPKDGEERTTGGTPAIELGGGEASHDKEKDDLLKLANRQRMSTQTRKVCLLLPKQILYSFFSVSFPPFLLSPTSHFQFCPWWLSHPLFFFYGCGNQTPL